MRKFAFKSEISFLDAKNKGLGGGQGPEIDEISLALIGSQTDTVPSRKMEIIFLAPLYAPLKMKISKAGYAWWQQTVK